VTPKAGTKTATKPRMNAADREQQLLRAAVTAFAEGGYAGTTTDQVARLAGVSQPYVVRVFGTKQALFLAAYKYATERIEATFRASAAAADQLGAATVQQRLEALGHAYIDLVQDRELLSMLLHGFVAAADPALGPEMRRCMTSIYRLMRELSGADAEQARDFLARGMLINTLVALRMPDHVDEDPAAAELVRFCLEAPPEG
jgi:AcrR family transcriptional regulator